MRIRLKGINSKRKRLADGSFKTYYWAWKGGPPLRGEPGTPEFVHSYNAAIATKAATPQGKLLSVLQCYQASGEFNGLADRTRFDYIGRIKVIETDFGDFPISALTDRRTRGIFKAWRDRLALKSRRQADYAWQVLALVLAWALDGGLVAANPCARGGRLYRGSRVDKIWTADDETAFLKSAPAHFHLPLLLALWTGQRQGDLLRLPWSAYDGTHIRLVQSKSMRQDARPVRVTIPVGAPLKAALDAATKHSPLILTNSLRRPWTPHGFQTSWSIAARKAGIVGVTFHDLRGTAVTRLAIGGCTEAEIATITGHSLRDVRSILDANYLHRDPALAASAIRKLERGAGKSPDFFPTGPKAVQRMKERPAKSNS
jgi:integrase